MWEVHATNASAAPGGSHGGQGMDPYGQGPARALCDEKEWAVADARQNVGFLPPRPLLPLRETSLNAAIALVLFNSQLTAAQASALVLQLSHFALPLPLPFTHHTTHSSHAHQHHTPHTSTVVFPPGEAAGKQSQASGCSEHVIIIIMIRYPLRSNGNSFMILGLI